MGISDLFFRSFAVTAYSDFSTFKYITVTNEINKPVKYLRYQSSDKTWGNMAEVEFYAKGESKPLRGKIIGRYDASIYYPRNGAEKLFDLAHILTFSCHGRIV